MTNSFVSYSRENGGRVLLLFLLFCLAIYELTTSGIPGLAIVCLLPLIVLFIYIAFNWKMTTFWALFVINYFLQMKDVNLPVPMSLPNEFLEIVLLSIAIVDARQMPHFERAGNLMLFTLVVWCSFCTLEILNDTCNLGINIGSWYTGARMMAFQLLYVFLVYTIYINSPQTLIKYLYLWGILSLFSVFWIWKQKTFGFTTAENIWMETRGRATHIIQGGTLTRYFSTFSDAANYGCNAAATAVCFIIIGISTKIKRFRFFFLVSAVLIIWAMFQTGTRTAIFCLGVGLLTYVFLSKSIKIAVPFTIAFLFFAFILVFTDIGNGNQQIRRMRSAFKKNDRSSGVRDINQAVMKKYIRDAPWGIGIGMGRDNVPTNNKYNRLATIPPDSEYVFIWLRTGPIGITIFIITTLIMLGGACQIVFFKLKNKSLIGIGGGLCGAFVAIQLGGYGNQVLMQFPNCLIFYGGLTIVYVLPYLEPAWIDYENNLLIEQEEKKRLKIEKKLASRV